MGDTSTIRRDAIRHNQNQLLYAGVKFSAAGSLAAAIVLVLTFQSFSNHTMAYSWMALVSIVYVARLVDNYFFTHSATSAEQPQRWSRRFNFGALLSSIAWALSIWMLFPDNEPAYQVLLILTIGGVAGGALASLPYDNKLCLLFQCILILSVEVKLLLIGTPFSLELALFSAFVFGFLISCGKKVGENYIELLRLKQDSQDTNVTLIKTTEQMAQMGYWQWEEPSKTVDLSENLARLLGFSDRRVPFTACIKKVHPDDKQSVRESLDSAIEDESASETSLEYRLGTRDDKNPRYIRQLIKRLNDSDGKLSLFGSVQDISDIKKAESKIYKMAYYDGLTELANRYHFHERMETYLKRAEKQKQLFAIIYIDLDNFKGVNDSYGHECGDKYLIEFGQHLRSVVSKTDFLARLGGDEFCVLVQDISGADEVQHIAERCLAFGDQPIEIGNHRIHPKLSIGISVYPKDGQQQDELLKNADLAMYHVKKNGKQSYAFFDESMAKDTSERVKLEADLRKALTDENFELWYQPKMDIRNNTIAGVEALIRWRHPEKGLIPPDLFITTAERVGVIKDIGEWVMVTACHQLKLWNEKGYSLQMAVNISGDHFASMGFTQFVQDAVDESGISPGDLEVEITESLSRDPVTHTRICHELRASGIKVAIDDFGTGYSSLSVLGELEVDTLKIDRSFIQHLPEDESSKLMVKTIADLALGLGYEFVAEGVETQEQLDFIRDVQCPYVQGYFFSKPIVADELEALLADEFTRKLAA